MITLKTPLTEDDIQDIAIAVTDKLVSLGLIPDCIDTDNQHEFEVQDTIVEVLTDKLSKK